MRPAPERCICPGCDRASRGGSGICPRCSRYVPAEIWLAIHDHADAWNHAAAAEKSFIAWAWNLMVRLAAAEASRYRRAKRHAFEPDAPGRHRWVLDPDGALGVELL